MTEVPLPQVSPTDDSGWHLLPLEGALDVSAAARLREQFADAVTEGHNHLVVDLSAVTFMDSTGLGVLVGGLKRVRMHDGALRLTGAGRDVLRLLRITGLDKVLPVYDSVEAAQAAPHGPEPLVAM